MMEIVLKFKLLIDRKLFFKIGIKNGEFCKIDWFIFIYYESLEGWVINKII